jgi:EmrB/QacA subfamily drug resistance transporter
MNHKKRFFNIQYRYIVAILYACVLFLDRLDLTIVNITLPTLANVFNVPLTATEWINNAYLLALAMSIPISGWAGDRFGVKKVFVIATSIFGLASLFSAFAPNLASLIMCRFLQGVGGGMVVPVGMTMVYRVFDKGEYASITSYIFIPTLIAPAASPALGGVIMHYFGWQWVFLSAVPICLLIVIFSILLLKEQQHAEKQALDWLGFIFASSAFTLLLVFMFLLGKNQNLALTLSVFGLAFILSLLFLRHESKCIHPLIDLKFFKNKLFLQINLVQLAFQICHFGSIFLIGLYLQSGVGMSAIIAGLIMGMQAIGAICTSRFSVRLFHDYGPRLPIITGFVGIALLTPCILLINKPDLVGLGCILLFLRGLFSGLCGTPIQTASIIGFKKEDVARASAVFNATRQLSISFGIALTALLINHGLKKYGIDALALITTTGRKVFYSAFMLIPVVAALGIYVTSNIDNNNALSLTRENR